MSTEARERLAALPPEKRRLLEARLLAARRGAAGTPAALPRSEGENEFPTTPAQRRLWVLDRMDPGNGAYNIPFVLRLSGELNVAVLERTLNALRARHEALRTVFRERDGVPVQVVLPPAAVPLGLTDLRALSPEERAEAAARESYANAHTGFDLEAGPLLRARLLRLEDEEHLLLACLHHIVGDGWSMDVLVRELAALHDAFRAGEDDPLPPLALQFGDWAAWQARARGAGAGAADLAFWRGALAGAPAALELPADRPRPAMETHRGGRIRFSVDEGTTADIRALALREGTTLFVVLLAAWRAVLGSRAGQDDVVVGTPVAGRSRRELEGLIGFFVDMLPLRGSLAGNPTFSELVARERRMLLDALDHQDIPFEKIVEALDPPRDTARNPLFQASFGLQRGAGVGIALGGTETRGEEIEYDFAKFDVGLDVLEAEGQLWLMLEYAADLFDPAPMQEMADALGALLERSVAAPDAPVAVLLAPAGGELARLAAWERTPGVAPVTAPVHRAFEAWVGRAPEATAVVFTGGAWSYGELDRRATALAHRLRAVGVGVDRPVGVLARHGPEAVAALLGVMKAGGAWMPLDPDAPAGRTAALLRSTAAAALLVVGEEDVGFDAGIPVVRCGEGWDREIAPPLPGVPAAALAYVLFTSGSTGEPRPVGVEHGALAAHLASAAARYGIGPADRVLAFAQLTFDPSLEQLLVPLTAGASVALRGRDVPGPAEYAEMVEALGVTVANPPTAYWHALAADRGALARVKAATRLLVTGGESLRPESAAAWASLAGDAPLLNGYGPTEAVVTCAGWELPAGWNPGARAPVGSPFPGRSLRLLDAGLRPAPIGAPAELYVAGDVLARGYLGRPAATAAAFLPDPGSEAPGARMYRTGDRARWLPDGALDFLGRVDQQVKVRGFRIEPGEIESVLRRHPAVRDAAVVARTGAGGTRLHAYVAAGEAAGADPLLDFLARHLPEYMVPATLTRLDRLPLTANGKIDRRALPEPEGPELTTHEPPETATERMLAEAWAELLGIAAAGRGDDFFALGGHSLLGARLVARLRDEAGVVLPLRDVFEHRTLRAMAARIDALGPAEDRAPIPRADRTRPLPLSFAQERLWFLEQLDPGSAFYNVPTALELRGPVDEDALGGAIEALALRHEVLRTAFEGTDGGPVQRILAPESCRMEVRDLSSMADAEREQEANRAVAREARRPFDLRAGPLMRTVLFRIGAERRILVLVLHHAATDATTGGILLRELAELYDAFRAGRPSPLPEPALQYADYAVWQRTWLSGEELERQLAYWRARLADAPATLELPTDRVRPPVQDLRGRTLHFSLTPGAVRAVRTPSAPGVTGFMVLTAGLAAVLHRWSGQEDVVLGTPATLRPRRELEGVAGFFGNTLPLRLDLGGDPTFATLVERVREATLGAFGHADVPFEKLVEALGTERSLSHPPLFQVMVAHQAAGAPHSGKLGDAEVALADAPLDTSRFDLTAGFVEHPDGIGGWIEYATALFDPGTVERLVAHLDTLLRKAADAPEDAISTIPLLSAEEREWVVGRWNATATPRPEEGVHDLVAAQAERTPQAVALEWRGERRSYAEIEVRAEWIAGRLRALGAGPEVRVAVALERGVDLPVAVLGVLKAGAAYVAVDPSYPAGRVAYMLGDSRAAVLVTTRAVADRLPPSSTPVLLLDGGDEAVSGGPLPRIEGENLAYVLYTSGSTGRPKGAALPHRALANLVRWQLARWGDAAPARTLQFASLSFDVSFQEIFCTWAAGGTLVLVDDETRRDGEALLAYLRETRVERAFLPFAALQNLAETAAGADRRLPALREVVTAGEALRSTPQLRAFLRSNPDLRVDNQYGPSETHVVSAHRPVADGDAWPLLPPIGAPVENARLFVLDAHMRPAPIGVPGELYVAGLALGRGYLDRPGLTAERWLPDPFAPQPGGRIYRTGDRARWGANGELDYVGRADAQVKIRGFRVEPGEVEAALGAHPAVREAAVAVRGEGADRRLVAYVVAAEGAAPLDPLRDHLAETLPEHMVPTGWVALDRLPLTPSGKVDRRALPEPESSRAAARVLPRTPAEALVAGIWEQVLGVAPGAHDDFFALGGHSLRATRVISRVRDAFGVELPLRALFESPTVAGLAAKALAARSGGVAAAPPLRPRAADEPAPLSFAQQRFWFLERMGAAANAYTIPVALRLAGPLQAEPLAAALEALVERHESLRTVFRLRDGEPVQVVLPAGGPVLRIDDLSVGHDPERALARVAEAELSTPFDLERGPVFRARLLRIAPDDHALLVVFHHVVADGWSLDVFFRELAALYAAHRDGRPASLPPLPVQYADFAAWQRERLSGPTLAREVEHWRQVLAGAATLELPTDRPRPAVQRFRGGTVPVELGPELSAAVAETARARGATVFMVLLGALDVLLHRWSGATDVVVGSPIAGRTPRETEGMIGIFLNTLALRVDLGGDPTFGDLLARVRTVALDAFAHQEVPFERLLDALAVERSVSRHPLFQVLFSLQPAAEGAAGDGDFAGLGVRASEPDTGTAKLDLALAISDAGGELRGVFQYASDLWDESTVRGMAGQFRTLLAAAVADPAVPVSALPLHGAAERALALAAGRGLAVDHGAEPLHRRIEGWAARTPDAPAVVAPDGVLTYSELDRRATRLARRLRGEGSRPDQVVGVALERSAALLTAQLAVMKAGGAYLTIDPNAPPERAERMLAEAGALLVVAHPDARALATTGVRIVPPHAEVEAPRGTGRRDEPLPEVHPDQLAYLFFTSGSTGVPKGVAIPHRGVANLVGWYARAFGFGPGDRAVMMASPTFDISVLESWCALANGASVHVVPESVRTDPAALVRWMEAEGTTVAVASTPVAEALLDVLDRGTARPRALRLVLTGGDALRRRPPPDIRLVNQYGPTENSVASTAGEVHPEGAALPSIGTPVDNHRCLVLDARMEPAPEGVPGELFVGGPGVARGYAGQPGRTAAAFVPSPFADEPGARLYRTGDRVRRLASGALEFLGRADRQVKLRGHRIEPGEVESALLAHPGVAEAAVALRGSGGTARLVAYVVAPAGWSPDALRSHLRERLPDYMVPSAYVPMNALPMTPNGKLDRDALPEPAPEPRAGSAPRNALERRIAAVWEEVLGVERVGLDDNFFEIGGHSLLVARLGDRLREALDRDVSLVDVFQFPTVGALAAHLGAAADRAAESEPVREADAGARGAGRRDRMRRLRR